MTKKNMTKKNMASKDYPKKQQPNWIYAILIMLMGGCIFWAPQLQAHDTKDTIKGFGGSYLKYSNIKGTTVLIGGGMSAGIYNDTIFGFIGAGGKKMGYFGAYSGQIFKISDTFSIVPNITAAYGNYAGDALMFIDPGVNLEVRVSQHMKTVIGLNYRLENDNEDMNGASFTFGIQNGVF